MVANGSFPSVFGGRSIAIDAQRCIVFGASLATGEDSLTDLPGGRELRGYHLGSWLRAVIAQPKTDIACVSAKGALSSPDSGAP